VRWAVVIQANKLLWLPGPVDTGAQVIYAPDDDVALESLRQIGRRTYELKGARTSDAALQRIGDMLVRETERALDWQIPTTLTGGRRIITTIVMIPRTSVPGGYLTLNWFPIIADPATSLALLVPSRFWPEQFVVQWKANAAVTPSEHPSQTLAEITPSAAAVIRRMSPGGATALELRCIPDGDGFRYALNVVPADTPCVAHCLSQGIRFQVPDGFTLSVVPGTVIDYRGKGFVINNPNATREKRAGR